MIRSTAFMALALAICAGPLVAQDRPRPEDTEVWDPVPPVVTGSPTAGLPAPSDALMLFDGTGLAEWVNVRDGAPAGWVVEDGVATVNKQTGDIRTRRTFGSYQLHLEYRIPEHITGEGQGRGNSGLFMAFLEGDEENWGYEIQILDSYENGTYVNGMAGAVYKQSIPLANASLPPGAWQTYDVIWTAPEFDPNGELVSPARVTALLNGVLVQNGFTLEGSTVFVGPPSYRPHRDAYIMLQAHGDPSPPISFRNIWVREVGR